MYGKAVGGGGLEPQVGGNGCMGECQWRMGGANPSGVEPVRWVCKRWNQNHGNPICVHATPISAHMTTSMHTCARVHVVVCTRNRGRVRAREPGCVHGTPPPTLG